MAEVLLNDVPVLRGTIALPRVGVWHADLLVDSASLQQGPALLRTADDALRLQGMITNAAIVDERTEVRLVGGAAALPRVLPPKFYRGIPLRVPLVDLLRETGEQLSSASSAEVLDTPFAQWTRDAAPASVALTQLLRETGANWRILADGTLWIGRETWPVIEVPGEILEEHSTAGFVVHAADTIFGLLAPGTRWLDRRVSYVEHQINEASTRSRVWLERATTADRPLDADRPRGGIDALVSQLTRRMLLFALVPATVLEQDEDGTLQVQPDGSLLPSMVGVPIRTAAPGLSQRIAPGARVLLSFEEGNPAHPIATLWAQEDEKQVSARMHASEKITLHAPRIDLGDRAERGVARMEDSVGAGRLVIAAAPAPGPPGAGVTITFTYVDGRGAPQPPVVLALVGLITGSVLPPATSISLEGKITSASERVRCD